MHSRSLRLALAFLAVSILGGVGLARRADATPMLRLTSGTTVVTITDANGDGLVNFMGSIGTFTVNVTTGVSKPLLGSASQPRLDLSSLDISVTGSGTLTIEFTDTDFQDPLNWINGFETAIGGVTTGTLTAESFLDTSNTAFGTATQLASLGPFGPGAFAGSTASGVVPPGGPYSMTVVATITHAGGGQATSFNLALSPVPEPTTVVLLGLGSVGAGLVYRRRRRKYSK